MTWKLAWTALTFGAALGAAACSATAETSPADAEEAAASEDDIRAAGSRLVGAYTSALRGRYPSFDALVLNADGSFFADVDTGIRCVMAPCPSFERVTGRYTVTASYLRLRPAPTAETSQFHGDYPYGLDGDRLTISRDGSAWSNELDRQLSYCAEADDCAGQAITHVQCLGRWACDRRTCAWDCSFGPAVDEGEDANAEDAKAEDAKAAAE